MKRVFTVKFVFILLVFVNIAAKRQLLKRTRENRTFHSILDLLQETSFKANFNPFYDIVLSYLVKNSIQQVQRNMNRRGEKRVGAGREKSPSFTKITKEMNR